MTRCFIVLQTEHWERRRPELMGTIPPRSFSFSQIIWIKKFLMHFTFGLHHLIYFVTGKWKLESWFLWYSFVGVCKLFSQQKAIRVRKAVDRKKMYVAKISYIYALLKLYSNKLLRKVTGKRETKTWFWKLTKKLLYICLPQNFQFCPFKPAT